MPLMTKADYAKRGILQKDGQYRPVSKAYLSKSSMVARLEAAMVFDSALNRMMIDSDKADQILIDTEDPSRFMSHMGQGKTKQTNKETKTVGAFEAVKTDLQKTKLENELLNLAERKAEILSRADVVKAIMASGQIIREHLKTSSRRLAEKFSTMSDARQIRAVMEEEHTALLRQMSNDFLQRFPTLDTEGGQITAH